MTHTTQAQRKIDPDKVNALLEHLIGKLRCKNDVALSRALEFGAPVISKLRHGVLTPRAGFVLRAHEKAGISTEEIRDILGVGPEYKF